MKRFIKCCLPVLAVVLLVAVGNASQNGPISTETGTSSQNEKKTTGEVGYFDINGKPLNSYLYYQGRLYERNWWCLIVEEDLPYGTELVGTVQSVVDDHLPTKEFEAVGIPTGTAVLASSKDQADTLYVYCPKDKGSISWYYIVFFPSPEREIIGYTKRGNPEPALVDPEGKQDIMPYRGPVLHWGGRMWEFLNPFLIEKELKEGYAEAGEVLVQLPEVIADGQVHYEQFLPEKDGEASYVFSPGSKIYVLEKEKDAPTHLYVQKAPGQYIYVVPDGRDTVYILDEPFDPSQYK